ncbi:MAG: PIG-L family deacetylase [Pseudomonadota bacterium]
MPTEDQARIGMIAARPRIVQLWRALQPLQSVVSFKNTGAHPDDETSAMLAALGLRDGLDLSYACATRGEGGQNDIGTESGADLGVLRTLEMERASDVLGLRLYWLSESADDTITDFGFSKSGEDTLRRWGHARALARFVEIVRTERPDIICPTFLDIPGQHGHHRAMTQLAHEVMDAAADPGFGARGAPWQVKKLFLPAWSGAGDAYDDDLPPPEATCTVPATGRDWVTGATWFQIGQTSRACHRTQGMGRWVPAGAEHDWPLHLARSEVGGGSGDLTAGLPANLTDLAAFVETPELDDPLSGAQAAMEAARAAFPDGSAIARHAVAAVIALREARARCPAHAQGEVVHRVDRKLSQLAQVIRIASGAEALGWVREPVVAPGGSVDVEIEVADPILGAASVTFDVPDGWGVENGSLQVPADATMSDPLPAHYDPASPALPRLRVATTVAGLTTETGVSLQREVFVGVATPVSASPAKVLLNRASARRDFTISLSDPAARVEVPEGWGVERDADGISITVPESIDAGIWTLPVMLGDGPVMSVTRIGADHAGHRLRSIPTSVTVRVIDVALAEGKIGYVGGGNDAVLASLQDMGLDVENLTAERLATSDPFAGLDSLVVGVFAVRTRPDLRARIEDLHRWVEQGGNLLTLYHRPWDAWDPDVVPPRPLTIGKPSLRWRVTDEAAEVIHLAPGHPVLTTPNRIGPEDWAGWHKERGLYFAMDWAADYAPLLSMADPGEEPLNGSLLSAAVGAGRHTHCALILHHQMAQLVPGAFRLMANLVAPVHRS